MLIHTYDGVDLTDAVDLKDETTGYAVSAKLGEAEIITVVVDDPTGSRSFTGHKPWLIREDECPSGSQVIFAGFVGPKKISRGSRRTSTGRTWTIQIAECNTFMTRRLLRPESSTCDRPAETVTARVTWLLTTPGFTGVIVDAGLVVGSSVPLDKRDYTDATGADVLRDCALASGYNFFIRYREATDDFQLAFNLQESSGLDTSTLQVSNDPADVGDDASPWYPNKEADIEQIPDRVASGVAVDYASDSGGSGSVYRTDPTTAATFAEIDQVAPSGQVVKTASTATALADHLLAQHSTEEERVSGLVLDVPAANVNDVMAGQLISAKFVHGPGWESFRYARVTRKILSRPQNLTERRYLMGLELEPAANLEASVSNCRLYGPNDNNMPVGLDGTFLINWDTNGDGVGSTPSGCSLSPQSGAVDYSGTSEEWVGIVASGWGPLLINSVGTFEGAVASGTVTLTALLLVNGGVAATRQQVTSGGSARAISWTWSILNQAVTVAPGDLIQTQVTVNGMSGGILVIPAGTGDCSNMLWARGTLLVAV